MIKILWVDDEFDLLKPYFLFLQEKGYDVTSVSNGQDALDLCTHNAFDIIFLDENMPGLSGLETLTRLRELNATIPVVMITKNEEENIMDLAIGKRINDYLLKPVNPKQILLTLKKHVHEKEIVSDQTTSSYRQEFTLIAQQINECESAEDWMAVYKTLLRWDLRLSSTDNELQDLLQMQKQDANAAFSKFIQRNYQNWIAEINDRSGKTRAGNRPMLSVDFFKRVMFPLIEQGEKVFLIVIDNFRYDQWMAIQTELTDDFIITSDEPYLAILPTATQYARNALFSGLLPLQIRELYPHLWVDEDEEEGKNNHEEELIQTLLDRYRKPWTFSYHKVSTSVAEEAIVHRLNDLKSNDFNVCVLNFIDMLSHAKTDSRMMKELAQDEAAYRSLTISWFRHSAVRALFKALASKGFKIVLTTDHGTIRVKTPVRVVGEKSTNVNLRYKLGRNLGYNEKDVMTVKQPSSFGLPAPNVTTTYVFAGGNDFLVYPNNYNYYVNFFRDTFQHGGISLEEMVVPAVVLEPRT